MAKTIQTALMPILILGAMCGLCVIEYPIGRPRPYCTFLYFLMSWSIYTCIIYWLTTTTDESLFLPWTSIIIIMSSFVSMIVSLYRFKELKICLRQFSIVDNTLEALGTPKEYQRLHKWMIGVIITWAVLANLLNLLDALWEGIKHNFNVAYMCIPFIENILLHIDTINGVILGTILGYMGSRFERVNKHLRNLLENDMERTREGNASISVAPQRVLEAEECRRRVWIVMHVHLQLSLLSRELNKLFSVQLTLEMASLFAVLVEMFLEFLTVYMDKDASIFYQIAANMSIHVWAIMFTTKLLFLNYICQFVCDKANEAVVILYKLFNDDIDEDLREQTLQFILQIKQREVNFSGMGLFYFGNNFIRKFFSSMVTVLIIIIQMRGSKNYIINNDTASSTNNKD